jgi:hypothetical protein
VAAPRRGRCRPAGRRNRGRRSPVRLAVVDAGRDDDAHLDRRADPDDAHRSCDDVSRPYDRSVDDDSRNHPDEPFDLARDDRYFAPVDTTDLDGTHDDDDGHDDDADGHVDHADDNSHDDGGSTGGWNDDRAVARRQVKPDLARARRSRDLELPRRNIRTDA